MLTVELDDILGGAPIQHREIQGSESDLFLSYFKKGVRYLPGGIKSGFTHYDPEDVVRRLFKVKGKRNIQVSEVRNVNSKLLTFVSYDDFIGPNCCLLSKQI